MKKTQPLNKKTVAFAIIAFALVFSLTFIKLEPKLNLVAKIKGSATKEKEELSPLTVDSKVQNPTDSDKDGLLDWEEDLFGTKRDDSDSDDDGSLDGEEIKLGRNPTLSGTDKIEAGANLVYSDKKLSENENDFVQSLLSSSYSIQQGESDTTVEGAAEKLKAIAEKSFTFKQYTFADLKSTTNSSAEALRFYGSAFATVQVALLTDMAEKQEAISKNLKIMGDIYAKAAKNLSEIAVPVDLLSVHLKIINNYSTVASSYYAFEDYRENPIRATMAIQAFNKASEHHEEEVQSVASYLKSNGIIYTSQEVGSYWNRILAQLEE